jgi:hypothetical protein
MDPARADQILILQQQFLVHVPSDASPLRKIPSLPIRKHRPMTDLKRATKITSKAQPSATNDPTRCGFNFLDHTAFEELSAPLASYIANNVYAG